MSSTQPRQPVGSLPWVRASIDAVDRLARDEHTLITSLGTAPWDLVLCRAAGVGARMHVIAPVGNDPRADQARILHEYALPPALVTWQELQSTRSVGRRKDVWRQRDEEAFAAADAVFPVCVKPGGRIDEMLRAHQEKVDDRFRIAWQKPRPGPRAWDCPQPWRAPAPWPAHALLHLTRACDGPWPGETMHSYWADVARSESRYPRDGLATLCRILEERCVRASKFRIRGGASTVSLTALDPSGTTSLFRWRSRYARYSFEPYAIAVARDAVLRVGGCPVRYDDGAQSAAADPFRQGRGEDGRWEAEQEWRVQGALELSKLEPSELAALVATDEDAVVVRGKFPGLAVATFGGSNPGR